MYASEPLAVQGAENIRAKVEAASRTYDTLHPYKCPDANHWHLSHHEQGHVTCPVCRQTAPAWKLPESWSWVVAAHSPGGQGCSGESMCVEDKADV